MCKINDEVSNLFVLVKAGEYDESLSLIMSRVKCEMELESQSNPRPWYPFAYQHTPSDSTFRGHLDDWKAQYGELPRTVDVLFCPVDSDYYEWEESCYHEIPKKPDVDLSEKPDSWRYMDRSVDGTDEVPHHYAVGGSKRRYYALIIEDLELYPFDSMKKLSLAYCRTYPEGVKIGRVSTVNLWKKDSEAEESTPEDLYIIGRAVLREPHAVELRRKPWSIKE